MGQGKEGGGRESEERVRRRKLKRNRKWGNGLNNLLMTLPSPS